MRKSQVEAFKDAGYNVIVVLPNYNSNKLKRTNQGIILIPYKINERLTYSLHSRGLIECYLNNWIKNTVKYLKNVISTNDIIFATTGGELGTLAIAGKLKLLTQCKVIFNYHDPIADTSIFNNFPTNKSTKINKNKIEAKYLKNIDIILTSSERNKQALLDKHPFISDSKIKTIYFGFLQDLFDNNILKEKSPNKIRIVYGGSFSALQQPELLIKAAKGIENVEVIYIGNHANYAPIQEFKNDCTLLPAMPYNKYVNYLQTKADIGFVSLTDEYYGACVPSKMFEYINVAIPILGALPNGDAMDIINNKKYGLASHFSDIDQLKANIKSLSNSKETDIYKQNILSDRHEWSMDQNIKQVIELL